MTDNRDALPSRSAKLFANAATLAATALILCPTAGAQYAERGSLAGSGRPDVDVSGRSVKPPRVRAIHSDSNVDRGSTAWLIDRDPFLAYQLGRNLHFREFRTRDGVFRAAQGSSSPFDDGVGNLAGPMPDGTTSKITANNQVSCAACHNLPPGNPGGGTNFSKDSGLGRNAPHYYGAGLVEMLAIQVRQEILDQVDRDDSGWISAREAAAFQGNVLVRPEPGASPIDYGSPALDGQGRPQLNNIFRAWYVDSSGVYIPGATGVGDLGAVGYNFEMVVWGWGQGPGRSALNPTNRAFLWDPWTAHGGLDAYDPTTTDDPDGDGISRPSLCGAIQFPATHRPSDQGAALDPLGFSRDDPDGDGYLNEISEGDLDLAEFFMLNAPAPAFAGSPGQYQSGLQLLDSMGCAGCHTPAWKIRARGGDFTGDRRTFRLDVAWNQREARLEGQLEWLARKDGGLWVRDHGAAEVEGLFSDLKHHEMGPGFAEVGFDGTVNTLWRTAPLWGVGSGFPWGHDGQSLSLEEVILRHGGEAAASRAAFAGARPGEKRRLLDFLSKLRLYDVETLPTDIDGDGRIASDFIVAGRNTGPERFNAEWLFNRPVEIQGDYVNADGVTVTSYAATNLEAAYGLGLPMCADDDRDGWPNLWDRAPHKPGHKDGEND
jgi:hypothetical protein